MHQKPILFFIHGMSGAPWQMDNFREYFENLGYSVVVPALRHHDEHPDIKNPELATVGFMDYINDLKQEIEQLQDKPIIIGHSLGGLLAQVLTSKGLSKATVLLASLPPKDISALYYKSLPQHMKILFQWGWWKKPIKYSYTSMAYLFFNCMSESMAHEVYSKMVYDSGRVLFDIITGNIPAIDASKIDVRMLVIGGKHDRNGHPKLSEKIAQKYQFLATYKEFENNGHELTIEPGWQKVAEYILHWLSNTAFH